MFLHDQAPDHHGVLADICPQVLTIHCGDLDADCLDLERSHVPRMLQRLGTPLMSAFHLRLVNDKLNLRVIRPLLLLHDLQNIHNSYFKILWGLLFICRVLYILSIPSKGYDIYDICTTFLFLALLLIYTMMSEDL